MYCKFVKPSLEHVMFQIGGFTVELYSGTVTHPKFAVTRNVDYWNVSASKVHPVVFFGY